MTGGDDAISGTANLRGYNPPEREKVDCERCGDEEVIVFADRSEPALCGDCEAWVEDLEQPENIPKGANGPGTYQWYARRAGR